MMNNFAIAVSVGLHGAARRICRCLHIHKIEPAGMVQGNDLIKNATDLDYMFRELAELPRPHRSGACEAQGATFLMIWVV